MHCFLLQDETDNKLALQHLRISRYHLRELRAVLMQVNDYFMDLCVTPSAQM